MSSPHVLGSNFLQEDASSFKWDPGHRATRHFMRNSGPSSHGYGLSDPFIPDGNPNTGAQYDL